jgi:hypothetical protein
VTPAHAHHVAADAAPLLRGFASRARKDIRLIEIGCIDGNILVVTDRT